MTDHDCGGNQPSAAIQALDDAELAAELDKEFRADPWPNDWPSGHRGRQIREEQYHRRLARRA